MCILKQLTLGDMQTPCMRDARVGTYEYWYYRDSAVFSVPSEPALRTEHLLRRVEDILYGDQSMGMRMG